jgi:hypothetical protein
MATKEKKSDESIGLPSAAMVVIAVISAIVTGASFEIIKYWPLPVSVVPYFGWQGGVLWGLVVGAVSGLILGFCTDDSHFADS